jgi:hypothetical protein
MRTRCLLLTLALLGGGSAAASETQCDGNGLPNPVMFVLQYPVPQDFASIGSVFANHVGSVGAAGRGGDLMICYPDGTMRNLTREAGYGSVGQQGANSISVRDPAMHWSGEKAVFAMVIGAATQQYEVRTDYWQLYEITGFAQGATPVVTKVAAQPADFNNVQPAYLADDALVFVSDRPRNGARHLYPQLDEYESTPTPSGLWKLVPSTGRLTLLQHSPSGSFDPFVDSYGRVVFTRWDHLSRDQQGDGVTNPNGAFDYSSEAADATRLDQRIEVFPETRLPSPGFAGLRFNNFMPWMINPDGTGEETLNHVGRHEFHAYFERSFTDDPALSDFTPGPSGRPNQNSVLNVIHTIEDPTRPGRYLAINAPEFGSHAAGQLVAFDAPPSLNARDITVDYLSGIEGSGFPSPPPPGFARYRTPAVMPNGLVLASHTTTAVYAGNLGTRPSPQPGYAFRLRRLAVDGSGNVSPGNPLTQGVVRTISFYDPDVLVTYNGPMWEFSPIAVTARARPPVLAEPPLAAPELAAAAGTDVDMDSFKRFLRAWNLALIVVRNATSRDALDRQQPYNLRVPGGVQTIANDGRLYDVAHMQVIQGDQIRGYGGTANPSSGRRVLARWMTDLAAMRFNKPNPTGPAGSVPIAADGSVAVIVPAGRALSWQINQPDGTAVVRERYWLSLQPGEIRACDGCHGATATDQAGRPPAENPPLALTDLLTWFDATHDSMFADGFQP